ncbi:MAG: IclR family transcriptional regulator [Bilophila wadsworthia]
MPAGVSLEYGETFPGGNPGPAECRRSRPRGLPGYPYRLLKCCGRLHTPSRTGARFLAAFSNGASYLQPSIGKNGYGFQQKTIKGAQSVYRVLNILEEVILCGDRMITPKELSASLDIPVATVHRLLTVLRQKNFVACDPATKKYHIGDSCLISPRMDVAAFIRARFLPLAERISRRFGYSTILYARSGYDAVCVERLDGWHPIQVFLNKTGDRRPLGMGSATLSILAAMPEDEAEMILTHNEQEIRFVLKTDFSALRGFLAEARRKGYASAQGMLLEGTIGVSHVLRMGNEAVGSIAIDAVRSEQWDKDQPKIIQELQSALS